MNILLLKKFGNGWHGTLTLCKRLAMALQQLPEHKPFLFKYQPSQLINGILPEEQVLTMRLLKQGDAPPMDVILCLTNEDLFYGFYFKRRFFPDARIVLGVYHPRQMFNETYVMPNYLGLFYRKAAETIPGNNIYFMDKVCWETAANYFGRDYKGTEIIPLPFETNKTYVEPLNVNPNKIVSIGRLVDFKRYVFHVVTALTELRKQGHSLIFDIVGDGPLMPELKAYIKSQNAEGYVKLHGELSQHAYKEILRNAGLFIGMGTTVIESANLGIPTLVAIDSDDKGESYGFIHQLPQNTLGEQEKGLPRYTYHHLISQYLLEDDPSQIRRASWQAAQFYALDKVLGQLLDFCSKADRMYSLPIGAFSVPKFYLGKMQNRFLLKKEFRHK